MDADEVTFGVEDAAVAADRWLTIRPRDQASARIFCLPYAGSGASVFSHWQSSLPSSLEVCPIQLPGRENRLTEPPVRVVQELAEQIARQILPWLNRPFVLFGHSYGALLAFEVIRSLRRSGSPAPVKLLVSAFCAPRVRPFHRGLHQLDRKELMQWLQETSGEADEALADREWQDLLLPTLRADLEALEHYQYASEPLLECPVTAFVGKEDQIAPWEKMIAWRRETFADFKMHVIEGKHLFLRSTRTSLLRLIQQEMTTTLNGA
ncbi:MAG: alpha/beta fold hydrolase [Planctomycetaceae bacterium]|nr:alpha/beta fold hydrolase [Planctomycetaceae bacterium]